MVRTPQECAAARGLAPVEQTSGSSEAEIERLKQMLAGAQEAAAHRERAEVGTALNRANEILNGLPSDEATTVLARQFVRLIERERPDLILRKSQA